MQVSISRLWYVPPSLAPPSHSRCVDRANCLTCSGRRTRAICGSRREDVFSALHSCGRASSGQSDRIIFRVYPGNYCQSTGCAELPHYLVNMFLKSAFRKPELASDFRILVSARDSMDNFQFQDRQHHSDSGEGISSV